jgi:hypothetical protein
LGCVKDVQNCCDLVVATAHKVAQQKARTLAP